MSIQLRHVWAASGRPCSAVEDIAAIAASPNSWLFPREVEECRDFQGTEEEAAALRDRLEAACTSRLETWRMYQ